MYTVNLSCRNCSKDFSYSGKEYKRQSKIGRSEFYCSRACSMSWRNKNRSTEEQSKISSAISKRSKNNQYNKKGSFTYYLSMCKKRDVSCDLDDNYLADIWNLQEHKCAYSDIEIFLKKGKHELYTASLDRIDSSKGYVRGNVHFVAYGLNLAKNNFSDIKFREFIKNIKS